MKEYDIETCYWCGKFIGEGKIAYSSLSTDTVKTMRNFCSEEHLQEFKKHAKEDTSTYSGRYELKPYFGKED